MKRAFTLAEVLITLGIIGVVCAITICSLIGKSKEKQTVVKLKKVYSILSQAYNFAIEEYGTPESWCKTLNEADVYLTKLQPNMQFVKLCSSGEKCHQAEKLSYKSGTIINNIIFNPTNKTRASAILPDGIIVGTYIQSVDCSLKYGNSLALSNVCGEYMVDINGGRKPNKYGDDIFIFNITKYGIVPNGSALYTNSFYNFRNGCLNSGSNGWGCTAWVLYNENLDYLHCNDLDWNTKTKCK